MQDLLIPALLEHGGRVGKGELSAIAFAYRTRKAILTDDQKARTLASKTLAITTQTTPHLLGCHALFPHYRCLSTAGARSNPPWLSDLLAQGHKLLCGFDADPTGDNMADAMIRLYPVINRLRPALHDWNDVLRAHHR